MVYQILGSAPASAGIDSCKTFTACVGKRVCPAQYYLNDVDAVETLLSRLAHSESTCQSNNNTGVCAKPQEGMRHDLVGATL